MKVVVQSDARIWGGNEKWLVLVAAGLARRGHDVLVSCRRGHPVEERAGSEGLRVVHARPAGDGDVPRTLAFAAMLRRERPDVLLLTAFKRSLTGGWAARRAGVPRVVERLGIERELPPGWKYRHAFGHYIDAMIVNSSVIRDRWLASAPWYPASEVHVILNGVRPPTLARSSLREEIGVPPPTPIVVAAGRLETRKGFDLLLDAFARGGGPAHLAVAGEGEQENELRERAAKLGVADRVHWLGFRPDMDNVLLGADVFVLASRREGMANVMLEAMATGCLVVAADVSGVREAIGAHPDRPAAGWVTPVGDSTALGSALAAALEAAASADRGERWRRETRWRVEHWFSLERMLEQTERVLAAARSGAVTSARPGS